MSRRSLANLGGPRCPVRRGSAGPSAGDCMNDCVKHEDQNPRQSSTPVLAPGPLFVVSMWRSGSSLAYALLNKHPQVALMYEADLMLLRSAFLSPKPLRDWPERWELLNEAPTRHKIAATDVAQVCSDFPAAFTAAHQSYARRHGATIWGDKSPNYYDRLNRMADDFPRPASSSSGATPPVLPTPFCVQPRSATLTSAARERLFAASSVTSDLSGSATGC